MGLDRAIDITAEQRKTILALLERHLPDTAAWVYGSRAQWASRPQSDLDMVVFASSEQAGRVSDLREAFDESNLPFRVDLFVWDAVPEQFRKHIERDHVVLAEVTDSNSTVRNWLYHPRFPEYWDRKTLYSMARWVNGLAFRDIQFSPTGKPIIKIAEIKGGISGQTKFTRQVFDYSVRIRHGDLLFSWSGQPETSIDAFWWRGPEGWLNQHVFRVTPTHGVDTAFLYYLLRYLKPHFVGIARNKQTTGLGHVTKRDLENMEVAAPALPEQRAIAHILGTLDDKIELNRRMNETLEAMARALFKSWFVDFDPVRAKMAGRLSDGQAGDPGLPQPLADLFPNRLVDSELGEVPEGWEVVPLLEIMDFKEGPGIRHWQYTNSAEGTRFINIRCIQDGDLLLSTSNRITTEEANGKYAHFHLKEWDIVVSSSGTLGRSAVVRKGHLPLLLNTSVIRFRPVKGATSFSYLHGYLNSSVFLSELRLLASGSVQKNFGPTHLREMRVLCPPYHCIERYEEITGPFFREAIAKRTCNDALTALRDTLLPKLISGELRVDVGGI